MSESYIEEHLEMAEKTINKDHSKEQLIIVKSKLMDIQKRIKKLEED